MNPFVSVPRFFIIPAIADAACPSAMRVWSTSSSSNRAASAATPSVSWKPWLNQPRLMSSLPRGPRQTFIVCAVISHPITHAVTTSRPERAELLAQRDARRGERAVRVAAERRDVVVLERVRRRAVHERGERGRRLEVARGHGAHRRAALRAHPFGQEPSGRHRHPRELVAERVEHEVPHPLDGDRRHVGVVDLHDPFGHLLGDRSVRRCSSCRSLRRVRGAR